jgi:branched-chain amino acid aminotransferase
MADEYVPKPHLKIWLDGKMVPVADAKISVYDHGLLYGDGVFEGIRIYNSRIFECTAHMERLYRSAAAIRMKIPFDREALVQATRDCMRANEVVNGYVRMCVTRGVGSLGIHPFRTVRPSVFIIVDSIAMYEKEMYEKGMKIVTASTIRNHPAALSPMIKSMNYLNNILAKIEAVDAGCLEAVMLNHEGYVAECTGDNLFIVKDGVVRTPATHCGILVGVTRSVIIRLAKKAGLQVDETTLTKIDLYMADEAFITGTGAEVCPVVEIDKRPLGDGVPGPITKKLIEAFRAYTREGGE